MKAGGVSLLGSYHQENQDAWWCGTDGSGVALAVSDGLGSRPRSAVGSRAFCRSVEELFSAPPELLPDDPEELCRGLHALWLTNLEGVPAEECCATALFAIAREGTLTLGAVGDGCLAALTDGGRATVLRDEKEERFLNETDCLDECCPPESWRVRRLTYETLEGLVAMTDGIELYPNEDETVARFAADFCAAYRDMDQAEMEREIEAWVARWPGEDDKTIAYCVGGDEQDGSL